mmetsp:Transcript_27427/g.76921  ORF Transcript_27427/g.76921 Transcript_27427/m.76921 type:complete len:371 (-) Transcript_27427:313-1425(-)
MPKAATILSRRCQPRIMNGAVSSTMGIGADGPPRVATAQTQSQPQTAAGQHSSASPGATGHAAAPRTSTTNGSRRSPPVPPPRKVSFEDGHDMAVPDDLQADDCQHPHQHRHQLQIQLQHRHESAAVHGGASGRHSVHAAAEQPAQSPSQSPSPSSPKPCLARRPTSKCLANLCTESESLPSLLSGAGKILVPDGLGDHSDETSRSSSWGHFVEMSIPADGTHHQRSLHRQSHCHDRHLPQVSHVPLRFQNKLALRSRRRMRDFVEPYRRHRPRERSSTHFSCARSAAKSWSQRLHRVPSLCNAASAKASFSTSSGASHQASDPTGTTSQLQTCEIGADASRNEHGHSDASTGPLIRAIQNLSVESTFQN